MTPADRAEELFEADFRDLLKNPAFRRWFMHLLDSHRWAAVGAFLVDPANINQTLLDAGGQRLGIALRSLAQTLEPALFMRALNEQLNVRAAVSAAPKKETA